MIRIITPAYVTSSFKFRKQNNRKNIIITIFSYLTLAFRQKNTEFWTEWNQAFPKLNTWNGGRTAHTSEVSIFSILFMAGNWNNRVPCIGMTVTQNFMKIRLFVQKLYGRKNISMWYYKNKNKGSRIRARNDSNKHNYSGNLHVKLIFWQVMIQS